MHAPRSMATGGIPERIDLRRIAPQPWRNGAGLTRQIGVAHGADTATGFDWRMSVAEVDRDAPFSAFPGVDRCIVLLRGAGIRLRTTPTPTTEDDANHHNSNHHNDHNNDHEFEHRLDTRFEPFYFSGDVPLHATLLGGPSSDFNVMVRRNAWRAEVACHHTAAGVPAAPVLLLLACVGEWRIGVDASTALTLRADQGVLWRTPRDPANALNVKPLHADGEARLLQVRLCHDQAP